MKIKFEVELKKLKKSNGFANRLIAEVQEDKRQLNICYKVNKATTIAHSKLMDAMIEELNEELALLGCAWKKVNNGINSMKGENEYYRSEAVLLKRMRISINGISQRDSGLEKRVDTKYTTFCGEYNIAIKSVIHDEWSEVKFDDILERCKDVIIKNYERE